MHWEQLTGDAFAEAAAHAGGVCLLPLSCIERHGHHLPLGTDMFIARELCRRTAALEPAIIFPDFIFTQILEARHWPGTIAIEPELILRLLDNASREIARNGLKKIVIVNAHGGNQHLIHFFAQSQLASPRDYVVYIAQPPLPAAEAAAIQAQWQTQVDGHAGEQETSAMLVIRPDLVHLDAAPGDDEGLPLGRLQSLRDAGVYTGIWWYADHPTHYRGDARPASAEKGERWLAARSRALAHAVRAIKSDPTAASLHSEFFTRSA